MSQGDVGTRTEQTSEPAQAGEANPAPDGDEPAPATTRFAQAGGIPPVGDGFADAEPTASEAAYGDAASASPAPAHHAARRGHGHQHTTPALAAEHRLTGGANPDHAFDVKRAPKHAYHARQDALNKDLKTPHGKGEFMGRPSVTLGRGARQHDHFQVKGTDPKKRYLIATNGDGHRAIEHGEITAADVQAHGGRLAVNPAHVRELVLPGSRKHQPCVLTWFGAQGSAWMRVADLEDGEKIAHAANKLATKDDPQARKGALQHTTRFRIRDGGIAKATARDDTRYMSPHQHSYHSNHKSDYLEEPDGRVNLCMSLPGENAAAIALDVLMPGQFVFVPDEDQHGIPAEYVREVAVYKHGAAKTREREVFVFVFVGKSPTEPDRTRSGWLPLRVVEPAPT